MTSRTGGPLTQWYRSRITEPTTHDEAQGYWIFVVGLIGGIVGISLFAFSEPAGAMRRWSIFAGAGGLALLIAGPIIRLPLQRTATYLVYVGLLICAAAILWFSATFPQGWSTQTGNSEVIGLYSIGLAIITIGGVFVPVFTDPVKTAEAEQQAADAASTSAERDELRETVDDLQGEYESLVDEHEDVTAERDGLEAELEGLRTSQARFELFEDKAGEFRWRLRHRNGNIIASSGEGYTARHNAQNGLDSVRRNALGADLLRIEPETPVEEVETEPFKPPVEASQARFEVYQDKADEFRWRLVHDNGNILADSGEGYVSRQGVRKGLGSVKTNAGAAEYLRIDPTAVEIYKDKGGKWRWRLIHKNGNVLADGGQGFSSRSAARKSVDSLKNGSGEFEVYEDEGGEYRWRIQHSNGNVMADSGEGYASKGNAEDAVERVREYLPEANVLDVNQAAFEIYKDRGGEYRWRLRHRNGNIIADGGEGYSSRSAAEDAVDSVKRNASGADVDEQ